jgi:cation/acetate symporter
MSPWLLGISPEGIGTVDMLLNFIVTYIVSRITPPPPLEVQEMVARLRSPEGNNGLVSDLGEEQLS